MDTAKELLHKKCPYSELFWPAFSRIRTEYGEIRISPYSVRMWEMVDQNNSEHGHFLQSALIIKLLTERLAQVPQCVFFI